MIIIMENDNSQSIKNKKRVDNIKEYYKKKTFEKKTSTC